jgi:hypothetical protein
MRGRATVVAGLIAVVVGTSVPGAEALPLANRSPRSAYVRHNTRLRLQTFRHIVVAPRGRVFVSADRRVFELDRDGRLLATLRSLPGADGLAVAGHLLFVATSKANRIERFDLRKTPPARLLPILLPTNYRPRELVFAAGRIWFTVRGCENHLDGQIGSANPDGTELSFFPGAAEAWGDCPRIDGGDWAPRVFVWNTGFAHSPVLYEYDVSHGIPVQVDRRTSTYLEDVATLPGGHAVLLQTYYGVQKRRLSDLGLLANFPVGQYVPSLAVTKAHGVKYALEGGDTVRQVTVFSAGRLHRVFNYPGLAGAGTFFGGSPYGAAFSLSGNRLFLVRSFTRNPAVSVLLPFAVRTALTLRIAAVRPRKRFARVRIDLSHAPPGARVRLFAKPRGGHRRALGSVVLGRGGDARVRVPLARATVVSGRFRGDDLHLPSTDRITVARAVRTSLRLRLSPRRPAYGRLATLHIALWPAPRHARVTLYGTPIYGVRHNLGEVALNRFGRADVGLRLAKNTVLDAAFGGSRFHQPSKAELVVPVRTIVGERLFRGHGFDGRYRVYHRGEDVLAAGFVIPNHAGAYLMFMLQRPTSSGWRLLAKRPFVLDRYSVAGVRVSRLRVGRYRLRALFGQDDDHSGGVSPYRYIEVTTGGSGAGGSAGRWSLPHTAFERPRLTPSVVTSLLRGSTLRRPPDTTSRP